MRKFAFKRPIAFSVLVFLAVMMLIMALGVGLGVLVMMNSNCEPRSASDPCDGGAMAVGAIWVLTFWAGILLDSVAGLGSFIFLTIQSKKRSG